MALITNTEKLTFDVIEITNEMPINKLGGVGSVIENLMSGFMAIGIRPLWFLVDHDYNQKEKQKILSEYTDIAIGTYEDIRQFRSPIVHLHTYFHNPELFRYLSGKKVIFTIHSLLICEAHSNNVDLTWSIEQQKKYIEQADEIVLISKAELDNYYKFNYHKLNPNIHIIHNGLKNPSQPRKQTENKNIGFCGRLVPRKHPEYIQMILCEKGFEDYHALIAGRGFSHYAHSLINKFNLKNRVFYLGWCAKERLESFYKAIDVLAIPSIYEPFGMVALEAAARKIPIVCAPVDGLIEILANHAFFSQDASYSSFQVAMKSWLLASKSTIKAKAEAAYKRYQHHFTDLKMAQRYQQLFQIF